MGNALQEYTRTVAHQHAAVTDIQTALTNCLSDLEAHNRELSSKIKEIVSDDQAFFQSRLTKRGSEEYKATPAELSQSEKITKLQEMLRTYPELPEEGNLTAYDVDNITEARVEHHAVVMNLAADCLKDSYIGQQYQASSGLLHS
ncbi:MAG: hypothetical protein K0Q74_953 [Gammaproteobacteria bacterium]|nr:hypothetical protein [Gammaproteobacteria bacterium]